MPLYNHGSVLADEVSQGPQVGLHRSCKSEGYVLWSRVVNVLCSYSMLLCLPSMLAYCTLSKCVLFS